VGVHRHVTRLLRCSALFVSLCLLLAVRPGVAQTTRSLPEVENLVNYAYGNLFGTGIYSLEGRTVGILQFPIGFELREAEKNRFGMRFELPIAIGIQDYHFDSIPEFDVDNLATLSVLPGVRFSFLVKQRWSLDPSVYLGYGRDVTNHIGSVIYGAGLSSKYKFDLVKPRLTLGTNVIANGYTPQQGESRFITRFGLGLDALFPTGMTIADRNLLVGTFGVAYLFLNELEVKSPTDVPIKVRNEYEIGIAVAGDPAFKLLGFKFERMGLSYRFSEHTNAILLNGKFPF
jgi:hypothetical protein